MIYANEKEFPYKLNEQLNQDIFETEIVPNLFKNATKDNKELEVFFIGGQPASGKTDTLTSIQNDLKKRDIFLTAIDADSLRLYHPDYHKLNNIDDKNAAVHTGADIGRWTEKSIDYAIKNRINVVIEGTFREPKTVEKSIKLFKNAGYKINVQAIAVKSEASEISTHMRYEAQKATRGFGRYVPKEAHDAAYIGVPKSLKFVEENCLANVVKVRTRNAETIYFNEQNNNQWISPTLSDVILNQERNRTWNYSELIAHFNQIQEVKEMIISRNGTEEEIAVINNLENRHIDSFKNIDCTVPSLTQEKEDTDFWESFSKEVEDIKRDNRNKNIEVTHKKIIDEDTNNEDDVRRNH